MMKQTCTPNWISRADTRITLTIGADPNITLTVKSH